MYLAAQIVFIGTGPLIQIGNLLWGCKKQNFPVHTKQNSKNLKNGYRSLNMGGRGSGSGRGSGRKMTARELVNSIRNSGPNGSGTAISITNSAGGG